MKYLMLALTGLIGTAPLFAEIVYSQNFDTTVLGITVIDSATQQGTGGGFSQRSWGNYDTIASLPSGWSATCTDSGACGVDAFVGSTPAGQTAFDFDGHTGILLNETPGANNTISTTLTGLNALTAGQTYTLSFEYWGDNNPTPTSSTYPFDVIINGNPTAYSGNDTGPPPDGTFNTATLSFVAVGGSDTLAFTETTTLPDESSVILDNISISSTPEPGTFGLLLSASGLMFLTWKLRRRRA